MLSKEAKIRIMESYLGFDYLLFGKPVTEVDTCCIFVIEDFIQTKGALLSTMIEMFRHVKPEFESIKGKVDETALKESASFWAKNMRRETIKVLATQKIREDIKKCVKEDVLHEKASDVEEFVNKRIKERAFSIAIDNYLIAKMLNENIDIKKMNDWQGRVIEDAYKVVRESLVESALLITD